MGSRCSILESVYVIIYSKWCWCWCWPVQIRREKRAGARQLLGDGSLGGGTWGLYLRIRSKNKRFLATSNWISLPYLLGGWGWGGGVIMTSNLAGLDTSKARSCHRGTPLFSTRLKIITKFMCIAHHLYITPPAGPSPAPAPAQPGHDRQGERTVHRIGL